MAKFFINRPVFAIVLSIIISLAGLIALTQLPIAQYPQIAPPTVTVSALYMGANAEIVDTTVAQVIEQQVNGIEGMTSMSSLSTDSGSYSLTVQFAPEVNADMATVQVQNRVAQAVSSLPQEVQQTGVTTEKSSQDIAMVFALYSPNDSYDLKFLKNYASIYVVDAIKRVKGVGSVMEFGSDYAMRVWLKPDRMLQLGLTVGEVYDSVTQQNVQAPAGAIGMQPGAPNQEFQYAARTKGRLVDKLEFENIIVRTNPNGSFVRMKDIAKVELGNRTYAIQPKMDGHTVAGFSILLTSDANALETISNVKAVMADAEKHFPADMKSKIIIDSSNFVRESVKEVVETLAIAFLLVLIVVFIFLHSWRATLIPMLAIPVSLIGTLGAFLILGFSINTLTLFAMVLAIGLVVDDAIVVVEAVEHHIRHSGLGPKEAALRAMEEVSAPIIAIAFVLASVFIPVAFLGGTTGILYRQFALTIAVSMALSAVVALSLTPALCSMLLKPYDANAAKGWLGRFFDGFNRFFDTLIEKYGQWVIKTIKFAKLGLVFLLIVVIGVVVLNKLVPASFVPDEDQGYLVGSLTLPEAANTSRTNKVLDTVSNQINKLPGVDTALSIGGYDVLSSGQKSSGGTIFIGLNPWHDRTNAQTQVGSIISEINMMDSTTYQGRLMAFPPPALPGMGSIGGLSLMLENTGGDTLAGMQTVLAAFLQEARKCPEIGMVYSTFQTNTPSYEFEIDRDKVNSLNLPMNAVFMTMQAYLGGFEINDFTLFDRNYKVVMQAEPEFRSDIDATRFFFIRNSAGGLVSLDTLLKAKQINAPSMVSRYNGSRSMPVNANPAPGYSTGQAMAALEQAAAKTLTGSYTYVWAGQSREEKEAGNQTAVIFTLAIVFVFLCLAALYESWSVPFAVLLSVPTGILGAFAFQYMRNFENCIYMQIGLIMLVGLAAKNAILIVEFAKIRVDKGMPAIEAAIESSKLRLRPILMTSLAFIIGCVPLMVATGAGSAARSAMGTAVVGGMLFATAMGIFLIPLLFVVIERINAFFSKKK
ncbi:MAG: multidrug efflux RND transporter permease subunit [Negativicutes bacterium]|jgi:hydrophobe/amphiphile efflux-1 (HAE1) family protein